MSVTVETVDLAVLPAALLATAKSQLRVDWAYDDDFIKSVLARAIGRFEQVNEVTINPTVVTWRLESSDFCNSRATLPVRPASAFTAEAGDPPVDVSSDYALAMKWDGIHGVPIQVLAGPAAQLVVQLTAGYANAATLPPSVLDVILRVAAHLYEHREILIPGTEFVAPDLKIDATWWTPRV